MKRTIKPIKTKLHKTAKRPGPKGKFEASMIEEVHKLAQFGLTNKEIAEFYEISISTFENYERKYFEFKQALLQGRLIDSLKAVASLHKQMLGYEVEEVEKREVMDRWGNVNVLEKRTIKHIQPNITATIYLLKTRHGDKWMDIMKTEHSETINHHIDLSSISDEELSLLEKIGIQITTNKVGERQFVDASRN